MWVLCMAPQVGRRSLEGLGVITQDADGAVARPTQETSPSTGPMIVVDAQSHQRTGVKDPVAQADCTLAALLFDQLVIVLQRHVVALQLLPPTGQLGLLGMGGVVGPTHLGLTVLADVSPPLRIAGIGIKAIQRTSPTTPPTSFRHEINSSSCGCCTY